MFLTKLPQLKLLSQLKENMISLAEFMLQNNGLANAKLVRFNVIFCLGIAVLALLLAPISQFSTPAQAVSQSINIQGKVTNANGTNVSDGVYDFVFKLYDGAGSGATNTFTESWTSAALFLSTMSSAPANGGT